MGIITDAVDESEAAERAFTIALTDRTNEVKPSLTAIAEGEDPGIDLPTIPFYENAEVSKMPAALYVRHDMELIQDVAKKASRGNDVGLLSPFGTGKTAFREIFLRDFGNRDDWVVTHLDNPRNTTPRQLYGTVIRAASNAGYRLDPTNYTQIRNGVPWETDEAEDAIKEVTRQAEADQTTLSLLVDQLEYMPEELWTPLKEIGDQRVSLIFVGRPEVRETLREEWPALDSRVDFLDRGIRPFEPEHIDEYVARALAYLRGSEFDAKAHEFDAVGERQDLLTADAIRMVHKETEGNQRLVQKALANIYPTAAEAWVDAGCPPLSDFEVDVNLVEQALSRLSDVSQVPDEQVNGSVDG